MELRAVPSDRKRAQWTPWFTECAAPTLENLRATVETQTRGLAMDSRIAMGEARNNAQAAGECVRSRLQ